MNARKQTEPEQAAAKPAQEQKKHEEAKQHPLHKVRSHPLFMDALFVLVLLLLAAAYTYWNDSQSKIYVENSQILAPVISLSPQMPGILGKIYVEVGDTVSKSQRLAEVGNGTIDAQAAGIIISVQDTPGAYVTPQTPVIQMIDPTKFRVIGKVQEDKGLKDIKPGQKVVFTADAFGSRLYNGTVESVSPTARSSDIMFSISDKRQEQEFDVSVLFDPFAYPELKNGMSTKMWIYK